MLELSGHILKSGRSCIQGFMSQFYYIPVFHLHHPITPPPLCSSPRLLLRLLAHKQSSEGSPKIPSERGSHRCIRYQAAPCVPRFGFFFQEKKGGGGLALRVKKKETGRRGGGAVRRQKYASVLRASKVSRACLLPVVGRGGGGGVLTCQRVRGLAE